MKPAYNLHNRVAQRGFTLMEVMIVVAIVAILASVAYASYQGHVTRSNRAAAVSFIMEVANRQERFLLDRRRYAETLDALGWNTVPAEVNDNYAVTVAAPDDATPPVYTITATPREPQASRDSNCGTLTLNSQGQRTASGGGDRCWR